MCSKVFVLLVLILNKNRLLFSLFKSYYINCIMDIACLIFQDSSSLLPLLSVHVSLLEFFSFASLCFGYHSISRKEVNFQTVSSISHLYLDGVPLDTVDYHI